MLPFTLYCTLISCIVNKFLFKATHTHAHAHTRHCKINHLIDVKWKIRHSGFLVCLAYYKPPPPPYWRSECNNWAERKRKGRGWGCRKEESRTSVTAVLINFQQNIARRPDQVFRHILSRYDHAFLIKIVGPWQDLLLRRKPDVGGVWNGYRTYRYLDFQVGKYKQRTMNEAQRLGSLMVDTGIRESHKSHSRNHSV